MTDTPDRDTPDHAQAGPGAVPPEPRPGRRRASRLVDIAEAVGVHTSTVSRVLNGDLAQSVRPEVYERIWHTARQQG
ncbi:MAG TPA: helix-turn-helix domain-containing protein [Streptosporangiaceae bacterium]